MALVTISGFPTSGKTTRAQELVTKFEQTISSNVDTRSKAPKRIVFICDHGLEPSETVGTTNSGNGEPKSSHITLVALCSPRSSYATAKDEKQARGHLFATAQRNLARDTVVILDAPNYIKGFRYQLHCEAKNLGLRSCVVHVAASMDDARQRNGKRLESVGKEVTSARKLQVEGSDRNDPYSEELWEDLARRYEEPNGMVRWDKPLFTVVESQEEEDWEMRIWREGVCGEGAGIGKGGSDGGGSLVKPNAAAVVPPPTDPDHLHSLDRTTQAIISLIQSHQKAHNDDPGGDLFFDPASSTTAVENGQMDDSESSLDMTLHLPDRILAPMQLQRLRRQFIALNRQQAGGMGMGAIGKGGIAAQERSSNARGDRQNSSKSLEASRVAELFIAWLNDGFERG